MAWQEPKTDWVSTDAVSFEHYNRIKGNIEYIHELAESLYAEFDIRDMGTEKSAVSLYTAEEWNKFEENIDAINKSTYPQQIGVKKTFFPNGMFIKFDELNRLESALMSMHKLLTVQKRNKRRLSFRF